MVKVGLLPPSLFVCPSRIPIFSIFNFFFFWKCKWRTVWPSGSVNRTCLFNVVMRQLQSFLELLLSAIWGELSLSFPRQEEILVEMSPISATRIHQLSPPPPGLVDSERGCRASVEIRRSSLVCSKSPTLFCHKLKQFAVTIKWTLFTFSIHISKIKENIHHNHREFNVKSSGQLQRGSICIRCASSSNRSTFLFDTDQRSPKLFRIQAFPLLGRTQWRWNNQEKTVGGKSVLASAVLRNSQRHA